MATLSSNPAARAALQRQRERFAAPIREARMTSNAEQFEATGNPWNMPAPSARPRPEKLPANILAQKAARARVLAEKLAHAAKMAAPREMTLREFQLNRMLRLDRELGLEPKLPDAANPFLNCGLATGINTRRHRGDPMDMPCPVAAKAEVKADYGQAFAYQRYVEIVNDDMTAAYNPLAFLD